MPGRIGLVTVWPVTGGSSDFNCATNGASLLNVNTNAGPPARRFCTVPIAVLFAFGIPTCT